jgi:glutamate dehydrogenase
VFEIFVYSPRARRHLRGGRAPAAAALVRPPRGFRTEILGLVKADGEERVIVPVGSRGGFVLKGAPAPIATPT